MFKYHESLEERDNKLSIGFWRCKSVIWSCIDIQKVNHYRISKKYHNKKNIDIYLYIERYVASRNVAVSAANSLQLNKRYTF